MSLEEIVSALTKCFFSHGGREYRIERRVESHLSPFPLQEQPKSNETCQKPPIIDGWHVHSVQLIQWFLSMLRDVPEWEIASSYQSETGGMSLTFQTQPKRYRTPLEDLPHLPEPPKFEWANLGKYIYGVTFVTLGKIELNESIRGTYEAIKTWVHEKIHLLNPHLEEYAVRALEAAIFFSGKSGEKYGKLPAGY